MLSDGNKIIVDEKTLDKIDFYFKVDNKKFNYAKQKIQSGIHTFEIHNVIYLNRWYAVFMIIFDFILTLFGGVKFGELFQNQGCEKFFVKYYGVIDNDIHISIVDGELVVDGIPCEIKHTHLNKIERILKKYNIVCAILLVTILTIIIFIILGSVFLW